MSRQDSEDFAPIRWGYERHTGIVPLLHYPAGEPLIEFSWQRPIDRIMLRPTGLHDFMAALFFVDAYIERGHEPPHLILPYIPGARQDRLNETGDFLFTAKSVAREVNMRNFKSVTVFDPHSDVASGMIDRCRIVHADECAPSGAYIDGESWDAVVSPDAGAEKRAGMVAKSLSIPLVHGWKSRDVTTGAITGFGLEDTQAHRRVLVVDDICDGGGTFIGLADVFRARGLIADLYVTHGIFSQGTEKLAERYGKLYCTDSVIAHRERVRVLNVCDTLFKEGL